MKFSPRVAMSILLVSMLWSPASKAYAADLPSASTREQIDTAMGRLERAVRRDQLAGKLTTEEADNYRSAIAQLEEEEAEYISGTGTLGPAMVARLQTVITRVQKKLDVAHHDRRIAVSNLADAEDDLKADIEQARVNGQLTADHAESLEKDLASVIEAQNAQSHNGILSYGNQLLLSYRLDRVAENFAHLLAELAPTSATADALASQTIDVLNHAKFSPDQTNEFRKQADQLQIELAKAHSIKADEIQQQQLTYVASQYELLKARIEQAETGKLIVVSPQSRAAQIDLAIADAVVAGNLTPAEAHELRAELQGTLNELGSGADLPIEKVNRAGLELERTASELQRWLHPSDNHWPGLEPYAAALKKRIDDSAAANRIAGDQQIKYNAQVDAINKLTANRRTAHGGKLDATDALDIAMQLERVNVALHHEEHDRNVSDPDIDALQRQLDKVIADGITSGRLAADGSLLTERLNHLTELRSNYEKTPGGLDARARLAIADSIQQTIDLTEEDMHRDVPLNAPLDIRLDHLGDTVSNAVANGYISIQRGAQYRAAVDTIYGDLTGARKSDIGLTALRSIGIAGDIDLLTAQIQDELRESAVLPAGIRELIEDTRSLIANAIADGRLTIGQGNELIAALDEQLASVNGSLHEQGGLSHGEGLQVAFNVRRIKSKFETELRDTDIPIADIAQQCQSLDAKLANALAAGQLSVTQAQQYKTALDGIISGDNFFRESDGGLSMPESIVLGMEVDQLSQAVNAVLAKSDSGNDVDTREAELLNRIKQLAASGRLSAKDTANLTYELDRIGQSEAAFRVSDEGLNFAEALNLTMDLDRLAMKVDALARGSVSTLQQPKSR